MFWKRKEIYSKLLNKRKEKGNYSALAGQALCMHVPPLEHLLPAPEHAPSSQLLVKAFQQLHPDSLTVTSSYTSPDPPFTDGDIPLAATTPLISKTIAIIAIRI